MESFIDIELICNNEAALDNSYISIRNTNFEEMNLKKYIIEDNYVDANNN